MFKTTISIGAAIFGLAALGTVALAADGGASQRTQIDPQMKRVLDAHRSLEQKAPSSLSVEEARKGAGPDAIIEKALKDHGKPPPRSTLSVAERQIPGPEGVTLSVRIYSPAEATGASPAVVYFHGGGFVVADLDTYDASARAIAEQSGARVISVNYRRAPETPFPAALDDATAAFRYIQSHPTEFSIDPAKIAVAGESAGANLATGVAIRQKKAGGPLPVYQLLITPFVSNDLTKPSHRLYGRGDFLVSTADVAWYWKQYLGDQWQLNRSPEALPIYATREDLRGLPPAMVIVAGLDPLKDEGNDYARKLTSAGVPVLLKHYPGVTHEFFGMGAVLDIAKEAQADAAEALEAAFQKKEEAPAVSRR